MSMFGISRTLFKGLSRGSNITQQCRMSIRGRIFIPPPSAGFSQNKISEMAM